MSTGPTITTASRRALTKTVFRLPGAIASLDLRSSRVGSQRRSRMASTGTLSRLLRDPSHFLMFSSTMSVTSRHRAWWRGVGVTHNAFVVEGFIDELAAVAKKDPVEYRRTLLDKAPRARAVLDLAAEKAGWGKPMPAGSGRGIAVVFGFGTYIAPVAEIAVGKDGQVRVSRVVCAVDCGQMVNPDTIRAQIEGGIIFGITAALYGQITIKDGRVEQTNFDSYQMLRINEAPTVEVHLIDSNEAPGGIGEPGTAAIAPAVVNAIFAATGKRLRKLPIDAGQLNGGSHV
jgi:isoquinoline 1-oxidoreductase subunit beta